MAKILARPRPKHDVPLSADWDERARPRGIWNDKRRKLKDPPLQLAPRRINLSAHAHKPFNLVRCALFGDRS
jgi:hypothetical protein